MKYIRTKDGIHKIFREQVSLYDFNDGCSVWGVNTKDFETSIFLPTTEILKQADTIEELVMPNDLLFFVNEFGNKIPFLVEDIDYTNAWLRTHDIFKIDELYIKKGNDYILVAKMNEKGELVLL